MNKIKLGFSAAALLWGAVGIGTGCSKEVDENYASLDEYLSSDSENCSDFIYPAEKTACATRNSNRTSCKSCCSDKSGICTRGANTLYAAQAKAVNDAWRDFSRSKANQKAACDGKARPSAATIVSVAALGAACVASVACAGVAVVGVIFLAGAAVVADHQANDQALASCRADKDNELATQRGIVTDQLNTINTNLNNALTTCGTRLTECNLRCDGASPACNY